MRIYKKIIFTILMSFFVAGISVAQPKLSLSKSKLIYESIFNRLQNVYLINNGNQQLEIDTVTYNSTLYYLRFNKYYQFPFYLDPGDSTLMDCIIEGYPWITSADTIDTMIIKSNSVNGNEKIGIKIDFYQDTLNEGTITGQITDGINPIANAEVYFFLEGNYIIRNVFTDANGNYIKDLPIGRYTFGAIADSYYVSFYDGKTNPFRSNLITIKSEQTINVNFNLNKIDYSGSGVSGRVLDSLSHALLKRAIIIVRKGDHTPNKIVNGNIPKLSKSNYAADTSRTYTGILNKDGTYSIEGIKDPGYYYIQSFSDYYIPTYYSKNKTSVFWQKADSIYINSNVNNLDIYMPRDSSIGGGTISGNILTSSSSSTVLSNVVVYAKSTSNSLVYNYGLSKEDGTYRVTNLPYGNYELVAQKIGLQDALAKNINITPTSFDTTGVDISFILSSTDDNRKIPNSFALFQNYPNPFNPSTIIRFYNPQSSYLNLKVYNILGEEVKRLLDGFTNSGMHEIEFSGSSLPSGIYFYQIEGEKFKLAKKMILLK